MSASASATPTRSPAPGRLGQFADLLLDQRQPQLHLIGADLDRWVRRAPADRRRGGSRPPARRPGSGRSPPAGCDRRGRRSPASRTQAQSTQTSLPPLSERQPAAVLDQETHRAGELVGLLRDHLDGQFLAGQVGAGQFETLRGVALVDVDDGRLRLVPARLQFLEGILGRLLGLVPAGCVVIGSHGLFLTSSSALVFVCISWIVIAAVDSLSCCWCWPGCPCIARRDCSGRNADGSPFCARDGSWSHRTRPTPPGGRAPGSSAGPRSVAGLALSSSSARAE